MCEIRPEAHIKCKAVSEETVMPGVRSMIEEPVPVDYVFVSGDAVLKDEGNTRTITFECAFNPKIVYLYGYKTESYTSGTLQVYQAFTMAMVCNLEELHINGSVTRYSRTRSSGSSSYSYNNTRSLLNVTCEFWRNSDGTVTIRLNENTAFSSLRSDMMLSFYAGYANESYEAFDAGYTAGEEAGHAAGYAEGEVVGDAAGYQRGYSEGEEAGRETGYAEGEAAGREAGYKTGYADGDAAGYANGYVEGVRAGEETGYQNGYAKGVTDGRVAGYKEGEEAGREAGYQEGHTAGYNEGEAEGYSKGYAEGEQFGRKQGYDEAIASLPVYNGEVADV